MKEIKDTNPNHYKVDGADFCKYMDDPKISGFGDWMFANGYNCALSFGKWERHYSRPGVYEDLNWWCSHCNMPTSYHDAGLFYEFCPHCGAKMERWTEPD